MVSRILKQIRDLANGGRGGRIRLALATGGIARIAAIFTNLLALPVAIHYLGSSQYGLMLTLTSVITWLSIANFGLSQGLQNVLTNAYVHGDERLQKGLVSTAIAGLSAISCLLIVIWIFVTSFVDWSTVFPTDNISIKAKIPLAINLVFTGFLINFILSFGAAIFAARQEVHLGNILAGAVSVVTLVSLIAVAKMDLGFLGMVFVTTFSSVVVNLAGIITYFCSPKLQSMRPSLKSVRITYLRRLFSSSAAFFVIQICGVVLFQTEPFLLIHFISSEAVTTYTVAAKLYAFAYSLFGFLAQPLWAAYGNAKSSFDLEWIHRVHRMLFRQFYIYYGVTFTCIVLFGQKLIYFWIGNAVMPSVYLLGFIGVYYGVRIWTDLYAILVNGLDLMAPQAISASIHVAITVGLNVILIPACQIYGLPIANALGYILVSMWALPLIANRALRTLAEGKKS